MVSLMANAWVLRTSAKWSMLKSHRKDERRTLIELIFLDFLLVEIL